MASRKKLLKFCNFWYSFSTLKIIEEKSAPQENNKVRLNTQKRSRPHWEINKAKLDFQKEEVGPTEVTEPI